MGSGNKQMHKVPIERDSGAAPGLLVRSELGGKVRVTITGQEQVVEISRLTTGQCKALAERDKGDRGNWQGLGTGAGLGLWSAEGNGKPSHGFRRRAYSQ